MTDINTVIANNIITQLKIQNKKRNELAKGIGTTKQVISKILNGSRMVNAVELHKIASYLNITMEELVSSHKKQPETSVVRAFMGQVTSEDAKEALSIADELADLILYHTKVMENTKNMMTPWEG